MVLRIDTKGGQRFEMNVTDAEITRIFSLAENHLDININANNGRVFVPYKSLDSMETHHGSIQP